MHHPEYQRLFWTVMCIVSASCNGSPMVSKKDLFQDGFEYLYNVEETVRAGVKKPMETASAFTTRYTLVLQSKGDQVFLKIKDARTAIYNGAVDRESSPFQNFVNVTATEIPFRIRYDNGLVTLLDVAENDTLSAKNIKRGLASVLQLDLGRLRRNNGDGQLEMVKENTIFGECLTTYDFIHTESYVTLVKYRDHVANCRDRPFRQISTLEVFTCPDADDVSEFFDTSSNTVYTLGPGDTEKEEYDIQKITVTSSLHIQPLKNSAWQYIFINQVLQLEEVRPIRDVMTLHTNLVSQRNLRYEFESDFKEQKLFEPRGYLNNLSGVPNSFSSQQELLEMFLAALYKMVDNLDDFQKPFDDLDVAHGEDGTGLWPMTQLLKSMDYVTLKSLYFELKIGTGYKQETMRNIFLDVVKISGTYSSVKLILQLVMSRELKPTLAGRLVTSIPFYIEAPNEDLLAEFQILLDSVSIHTMHLRYILYLTFGHLIRRTCMREYKCEEDIVNQHVYNIFLKFEGAEDYETKILLLQVLHNTGSPSVVDHLLPIVKDRTLPHQIRAHALAACGSVMRHGSLKVFKLFLPIFSDRNENQEVRAGAFNLLIMSHPTHSQMQQLARVSYSEKSRQILNLVYTSFRAISQNQDPCMNHMKKSANKILRRMKPFETKPTYSGNYFYEYFDKKHGFGALTQVGVVGDEHSGLPATITTQIKYHNQIYKVHLFLMSVRLEGLERTVMSKILLKLSSPLLKLEELSEILSPLNITARRQSRPNVEVHLRRGDATIYYQYFNHSNLERIADALQNMQLLQREFHINHHGITMMERIIYEHPTETGLPVKYLYSQSGTIYFRGTFTRNYSGDIFWRESQIKLNSMIHCMNSVNVLNPVTNTQHGVVQSRVIHMQLSAEIEFGWSLVRSDGLFIKLRRSAVQHPFTWMWHSRTSTHISCYAPSFLKRLCPLCAASVTVTRGSDFRRKKVFLSMDSSEVGIMTQGRVFDCEGYAVADAVNVLKRIFESHYNQYLTTRASRAIQHLLDYLLLYPYTESCGIIFDLRQSETEPISEVEANIRINRQDAVKEMNSFFKGSTYTLQAKVILKGKSVQSDDRQWTALLIYEHNSFKTRNILKMELARAPVTRNGQKAWMICVDYDSKFPNMPENIYDIKMDSELNFTIDVSIKLGESKDSQCPDPTSGPHLLVQRMSMVTDEQMSALMESWSYVQCQKDMVNREWKTVAVPLTDACYDAAFQITIPRNITYIIKYGNIPAEFQLFRETFRLYVKSLLFPYWNQHKVVKASEGSAGDQMKLLRLEFLVGRPMINIHFHTDTVHTDFLDVPAAMMSTLSSLLYSSRFNSLWQKLRKNDLVGYCAATVDTVRTLDNVTYIYNLTSYWTLISCDCSEQPRYAIFLHKTKIFHTLALKVYIGGHNIEMVPRTGDTSSLMQIKVNNIEIPDLGRPYSYQHNNSDENLFSFAKYGHVYYLRVPRMMLYLKYNGVSMELYIPTTQKMQHCGLCGDFNGESENELISPAGLRLESGYEMGEAYTLTAGALYSGDKQQDGHQHPSFGEKFMEYLYWL